MTRLIEIINREPPESERQVVVLVDGKALVIEAGRSINLAIEKDMTFTAGDELPAPVAIIEDEGDTAPPTDDETTHDPVAVAQAALADTSAQIAALDAEIAELTGTAGPGPLETVDQVEEDEPAADPDAERRKQVSELGLVTAERLGKLSFAQLRELGYQLNVKGTSSAELIRDILAAQDPR